MNQLKPRIKQYESVSTRLACLSDHNLTQLLAQAKPLREGIGGRSAVLAVDDVPVFVKKIPVTDMESLPFNKRSTANIFELPLCYQYGVGSAGFGVWRELATHTMTTNWVITDKCLNFPIMYHWRILPSKPTDKNSEYWGNLDDYLHYWEHSSAIRIRIEEINKASMYAAVFLEYIPQNLEDWLSNKIKQGGIKADRAVQCVNEHLQTTIHYMNTHGLFHFDAHFRNILTDGTTLFLSDFGLALSNQFELKQSDIEFLKQHHNYDQACLAVNLVHSIMSALHGQEGWKTQLHKILSEEQVNAKELTPTILNTIKHYGAAALVMDEFFQKVQKVSKLTPYPAKELSYLLKN